MLVQHVGVDIMSVHLCPHVVMDTLAERRSILMVES
jgi:hypothetical protein